VVIGIAKLEIKLVDASHHSRWLTIIRFDRVHGEKAFYRLRSMLDDPGFAYQRIGSKFGLTPQRIAMLDSDNASERYAGSLTS
jgi:hypothetical protein